MSPRTLIAVVAFAVAAVAIAFVLYMSLPAPSPSNAAALSDQTAETWTARLASRADSSHSNVGIEQAQDAGGNLETRPVQHLDGAAIYRCHHALHGKKYIQERVDDDCSGIAEGDDVGMQLCRRSLVSDHAYLLQLTAKAAGCPQSLIRASDYYIALRDAALSGDVNAQKCYLAGYFNPLGAGDSISKIQINEFLTLARQLIQSAFERGDWAVVHYLSDRPDHPGLLIYAYPFGSGHPATWYRMNYLLTLGSGEGTESDEARRIVSLIRSQNRLSPEEIQTAEAWARETYDRHFAATPYNKKIAASSFCNDDLG